MNQHDDYEFLRERMEKETERDNKLKEELSDSSMRKLEDYFTDTYDVMSDDPDEELNRFVEWFEEQPYHELLAILNK